MAAAFSLASVFSLLDNVSFPKSSCLTPSKPLLMPHQFPATTSRKKAAWRCQVCSNFYEHIPKQFRGENLKEGVMDNFKNFPEHLYGLPASQMEIFMNPDNPVARLAQNVTEESISSARYYRESTGLCRLTSKIGNTSMLPRFRGGLSGKFVSRSSRRGRSKSKPPDLPSKLVDGRIVYLGMPITPPVSELLVAQLMWLDWVDSSRPIHLYINSPGSENMVGQTVAGEGDVYAVADMMMLCKAKVYTVNLSMAYGQAALLLSLGDKGHRALQQNACTKLYLPRAPRSFGTVNDMWLKVTDHDQKTNCFLELLSEGIGKPKEELINDLVPSKIFMAGEAIKYGIADKILDKGDELYDKTNLYRQLARSKTSKLAQVAGLSKTRKSRATESDEALPAS